MARWSKPNRLGGYPTADLWRHVEQNTTALAEMFDHRRANPEVRQRVMFLHDAVLELRARGRQGRIVEPSEGRASRNAILGWDA